MLRTLLAERVEAAEISLALLGDEEIRELNRRHLAHDSSTDSLSFTLHRAGEAVVGDVYVGVDQAQRQAREEGITEVEELVRLAIHGTLHVLGWDHPEDLGARIDSAMWRRQEGLVCEVMRAV